MFCLFFFSSDFPCKQHEHKRYVVTENMSLLRSLFHSMSLREHQVYWEWSPAVFVLAVNEFVCVLDVEAFARAMQGSKGDAKEKEKEEDEDMSLN